MIDLPMMDKDKANHFAYGAGVAALPSLLFDWWLGLALCLVMALDKELIDLFDEDDETQASHADTLATLAGGAVVLAPLIVQG